jgi:UPF0755 protein
MKKLMSKAKGKRNVKSKLGKIGWVALIIGCLIVGYVGRWGYLRFFMPNVRIELQKEQPFLFIHTGATFEEVLTTLTQEKYLKDVKSFEWMADKMNYTSHVKPGKYLLKDGMSNRELLTMLRAGRQTPTRIIFHNVRFKSDLAADVSSQIEADSHSIQSLLDSDVYLGQFGFNSQTITAMFIPNTYEFYWNTSAEQFMERMHDEYKKFWTPGRIKKSTQIGFSQIEVSILASIIEEETQKNGEKPTMAGVYINRLSKGMPLQADPTVRFAFGDFSIKRILSKHLETDSPYNTYKYAGLPPGPICIPSIASIDAVLNYQRHDYLYFCAKEDFSGSHNYARTLEQHNRNAQKYQRALSKAGIMH